MIDWEFEAGNGVSLDSWTDAAVNMQIVHHAPADREPDQNWKCGCPRAYLDLDHYVLVQIGRRSDGRDDRRYRHFELEVAKRHAEALVRQKAERKWNER